MNRYIGFGGVGDCFIIILKLLELENQNYIYTHCEVKREKLKMIGELLKLFNINHKLKQVDNCKNYYTIHGLEYDKCFNVAAAGYINVPSRPYHWIPQRDNGFYNSFNDYKYIPKGEIYTDLIVQVNGGVGDNPRNIKHRGVEKYVARNFKNATEVHWVGTQEFKPSFGTSLSGKTSLLETLKLIESCNVFVGYNSILLYWALYNKKQCYLFKDHQGKYDIRIHNDWKPYVHYVNEYIV